MLHTTIHKLIIVSLLALAFFSAVVEAAEPTATPTPQAEKTPENAAKKTVTTINVNSATLEELVSLPGIGPKIAQKIIDGRPYETVDALLNVRGIGSSKLEKIRALVTVEEEKPEGKSMEQTKKAEPKTEKKATAPKSDTSKKE